jgi:menaquinone-dependent protoporphyrinogen IX oxidase
MERKSIATGYKGMIVCKGKYGATQQYAEWIANELQLPVFSPDSITREAIQTSDYLIVGSSVYIGRLLIKDWLLRNLDELKNKKLFLFVVCNTPAYETIERNGIIDRNIPAILKDHGELFFMPGRLVNNKLSWKDRLLLRIGSFFEKDPVKKKAMKTDSDNVKIEHIRDLIKSVRT